MNGNNVQQLAIPSYVNDISKNKWLERSLQDAITLRSNINSFKFYAVVCWLQTCQVMIVMEAIVMKMWWNGYGEWLCCHVALVRYGELCFARYV